MPDPTIGALVDAIEDMIDAQINRGPFTSAARKHTRERLIAALIAWKQAKEEP